MDGDEGKEAKKERDDASARTNPVTVHTIASVGRAGITAVARLRASTPRDDVNEADTLTLDGLRLEQVGASALVSKPLKRNPLTDIVLKECELIAAAVLKDTVKTTLVVFAT